MHPNLFSKNTPPRPLSEAFIASLAHDIKNTLCIAQGAITLAQLQPHTSTNLETANQAITKANELIEALLTYATTGTPPKKTQTQLGELLNHTLALIFNNTPEITHTLSLPNPLPTIELNRLDLFRILQNIFVNAQQAMGSKGHIFIHGKYLAQNGQPPTHLELKIQDTGPGISEEKLQQVFEPGFTTKAKGHGIGLAFAKNFLTHHNGDITAIASPGEGGTFILKLPLTPTPHLSPAKPPKPTPQQTLAMRKNRGKVLLLDDDELLTHVATEMLNLLGYETTITKKGEEAVQAYQTAKETGAPFSSVILDLTLPGSLDGNAVLQRLKDYDPQVKAFLSTGHTHHPIVKKFNEHGFTGCILKPYHLEDLDKALSKS